ncbi:hypothetical protein [Staphylothermus hellenicus]|uniref:Uncharacterized protein n=1 Tax=Staphylothermus hellenicus (strain DSM 12710 / JCM 10830 / BK20S6-10-b1 / P8) TaxID=591019 RepID=D7DBY1_STAHD|nr:hypothetical protein [Staphylothermus hellenicus]ADI31678.1 hypothetical protein Shell_0549 [Staphylothermus hellenicus DSM 12710]
MSIRARIIIAVSILVIIVFAEFLVFMQGFLPQSQVYIELKAPLYPGRAVYSTSINVFLGRGVYEVVINPSTKLSICIVSDNTTRVLNVSKPVKIRIFSETGLSITVLAIIEQYKTNLGTIRVVRRWI